MIRPICILAILLGVVLTVSPAMAATKVFLLGGQSNMAGCGAGEWDVACPSPYNAPQTAVKFWSSSSWVNLQPGFGFPNSVPNSFGPEVSFGYRLHQLLPNDDIYLVKLGVSGTNLAADWNPDAPGATYTTFKTTAAAAIQNLTAAGKSPTVAGMIWMQGESDALNNGSPNAAAAYAANLTNFIGTLRDKQKFADFANPNMPFVDGRITTYFGTAADNALVRNALTTVPGQVGQAAWINTDDLQCAFGGHYGTQGQIDLGLRFANAMVAVPEPSTLVLSATALLGLLAYAWRKRK
jgi:hypothetical protein